MFNIFTKLLTCNMKAITLQFQHQNTLQLSITVSKQVFTKQCCYNHQNHLCHRRCFSLLSIIRYKKLFSESGSKFIQNFTKQIIPAELQLNQKNSYSIYSKLYLNLNSHLLERRTCTLSLQRIRKKSIRRKDYEFPEVQEEDLCEEFERGGGPGGQKTNKTANCVVLRHLPTNIVVKCHVSRSLEKNREIARQNLKEKLDNLINGQNSFASKEREQIRLKKLKNMQKQKKRREMRNTLKETLSNDQKTETE